MLHLLATFDMPPNLSETNRQSFATEAAPTDQPPQFRDDEFGEVFWFWWYRFQKAAQRVLLLRSKIGAVEQLASRHHRPYQANRCSHLVGATSVAKLLLLVLTYVPNEAKPTAKASRLKSLLREGLVVESAFEFGE